MRVVPDPYLPAHGDVRYAVTHYDLSLDYRVETNRLDGRATLRVVALQDTDALRLDLSGLHVDRVRVDGARPPKVTSKDRAVRVRLARTLVAGASATLEVSYSGKPAPVPGPHGPAGWEELTDGLLVASQPYGAPSWFPCNDRADDKASYTISVTTDAGYAVFATGRPTGTSTRSGRTTWTFDQPAPTASYLVSVVIGKLEEQPLAGDPRVSVARPILRPLPASSPLLRLPDMMKALEGWFGPYPLDRFVAVVVDEPLEIPLESQGMASFGTNHLDAAWDNERLVVHELAHQWFGNAVTAATLSDIWLHEGFACYTEWLWSARRSQGTANQRARQHWDVLASQGQPATLGDPGMDHMFDDWVYKRGALTLHALRSALGDAPFFAMCRDWVATFGGGTATTADLRAVAARHSPGDVADLLDAWLDEKALPPCPGTEGPITHA